MFTSHTLIMYMPTLCDLRSTACMGNLIRHSHISIVVYGTYCPVYTQVVALCLFSITFSQPMCTSCAHLYRHALRSCSHVVRPGETCSSRVCTVGMARTALQGQCIVLYEPCTQCVHCRHTMTSQQVHANVPLMAGIYPMYDGIDGCTQQVTCQWH